MNGPRLLLYILSMVVAVALIFVGALQVGSLNSFSGGLTQIGVGLGLVLLNSSRVDRV